jgi:hypothetical protein
VGEAGGGLSPSNAGPLPGARQSCPTAGCSCDGAGPYRAPPRSGCGGPCSRFRVRFRGNRKLARAGVLAGPGAAPDLGHGRQPVQAARNGLMAACRRGRVTLAARRCFGGCARLCPKDAGLYLGTPETTPGGAPTPPLFAPSGLQRRGPRPAPCRHLRHVSLFLRRILQPVRSRRYLPRRAAAPRGGTRRASGCRPPGFATRPLWHPCPVKRDYHALCQISGLRARCKYDSLTKLRKTTPHLVASEAALKHPNRAPLAGRESAGNTRSRCRDAFGPQDTGSTTMADGRCNKPRRNRSWGR